MGVNEDIQAATEGMALANQALPLVKEMFGMMTGLVTTLTQTITQSINQVQGATTSGSTTAPVPAIPVTSQDNSGLISQSLDRCAEALEKIAAALANK